MRARARGPKRATSDKPPGFIGATLYAQGSGSRGTRRAACHHGLALGAAVRAGRVPGATSTGRPAAGDQQGATVGAAPGRPAKRRDGGRAFDRAGARPPWRRPPSSRARGVGAGAGRAGLSGVPIRAACRTRGLAREPGAAFERARPVRAVEVSRARGVPARSGACDTSGPDPWRPRSRVHWRSECRMWSNAAER